MIVVAGGVPDNRLAHSYAALTHASDAGTVTQTVAGGPGQPARDAPEGGGRRVPRRPPPSGLLISRGGERPECARRSTP